jgi:hypothetical protein
MTYGRPSFSVSVAVRSLRATQPATQYSAWMTVTPESYTAAKSPGNQVGCYSRVI